MSRLAWFALLAAACNPVSADPQTSVLPDAADEAPPPDAGAPDAPLPDATPQPIEVHALMNGAPIEGLPVLFHDASGAVVFQTVTDADGHASHLLLDGGMVTLVGGNRTLHTAAGARPGDVLTFRNVGYVRGGSAGDATFTFPPSTPGGTMDRLVVGACGPWHTYAPVASIPIFIGTECGISPANQWATMAVALDGNGVALGFTSLAEMPFSPGANSLPAFGGWFAPAQNGVYGVSGIPGSFERAYTTPTILAGDHVLAFPETAYDLTSTTGFTSRTYAFAGIGTGFVERVHVHGPYDAPAQRSSQVWLVARTAAPMAGTLDWADVGLPQLPIPTVDASDGARPRFTFTVPAGSEDTDGGALSIMWLATPNQVQGHWTMTFPPGVTEVQIPALPEALAGSRPTTSIDRIYLEHLYLADIGEGGPAAFRALPAPWHPATVVPPANGLWRVMLSNLGN